MESSLTVTDGDIVCNLHKLQAEDLSISSGRSFDEEQDDNDGVLGDDRLETLLLERNDPASRFQLGQFYFEREIYEKAFAEFEKLKDHEFHALYQLGVMYYDGLGVQENTEKGFEIMESICNSTKKKAASIIPYAQYNLGCAYYEGKGVKQSDDRAEDYWLLAARNGLPEGSVKAQSILGMFYSRPGETKLNIQKSYHWHQEATGNGSIESQGALGVMFEYGIGVRRDVRAAFKCLKGASERGNVYAQGNLAMHYYRHKLFNQAFEIAQSVCQLEDVKKIAKVTDCMPVYVAKGISLGCLVYGRCLYKGYGVEKNEEKSKIWFKQAFKYDPETIARFQDDMIFGYI
ncbi:LRP2-binding protein-like isoform X2 [Xenia sp. Carnegie-2017]|uniref:LRP2-binding protein-like isoform X2 n=1 Tax=Xenia sp. Carnegie-2017 TaxID=2897299 RepID=UPI001F04FD83|nr:LRP2-binding protein-like isoform X2 [Xenia sp. Carnegie-2017]